MLECIHSDLVKRFHQSFLADYLDSDDHSTIISKLKKARGNIKLERLEFYVSTFFHHLKMDGSNLEIEIYKKTSLEDSPGP